MSFFFFFLDSNSGPSITCMPYSLSLVVRYFPTLYHKYGCAIHPKVVIHNIDIRNKNWSFILILIIIKRSRYIKYTVRNSYIILILYLIPKSTHISRDRSPLNNLIPLPDIQSRIFSALHTLFILKILPSYFIFFPFKFLFYNIFSSSNNTICTGMFTTKLLY